MPKILMICDFNSLGALHCDNPRCGHNLPYGQETWGKHLIGYPCPRCDSNMLTRKDFESGEKLLRIAAWMNKWLGPIFGKDPERNPEAFNKVSMHVHNGKTTITKH